MFLEKITSPTLLIDEKRCRANIKRMAQKAATYNLDFKPHFKTHQSGDIGQWFRDEGVSGITVSSLKMAHYFAMHGWKDITIAFPINIREIDGINKLAGEIDLTLLLSDKDSLDALGNQLTNRVHIFIEIDTGSGRTGFSPDNAEELDQLIEELDEFDTLQWKGFYSHPGHSYGSRSKTEIGDIHSNVLKQCNSLKNRYNTSQNKLLICIGDTPCCSAGDNFTGIDQISPGNFVFYDVMQTEIGSCGIDDIAVVLACPVVSRYPRRNEIIVHGGAIHLSKESVQNGDRTHFGLPVFLEENGWRGMNGINYVKSISQEHGIIKCSTETMETINTGDLIGILPVHSCLTADLMMEYQTLNGKRLNHIRNRST